MLIGFLLPHISGTHYSCLVSKYYLYVEFDQFDVLLGLIDSSCALLPVPFAESNPKNLCPIPGLWVSVSLTWFLQWPVIA